MVANVTPPETSVRMGPAASRCATAMASTTVPGSMLSSSTASAPARAASATWSRASHSISTIRPGHSARARLHRIGDARPGQVVVLHQHGVGEAEAVAGATAGPHGRLFEQAQARRRLAGVEDRHRRVALVRGRHELRRQRRDAGQAAEEVQRRALGREDRPQRAGQLQHGVPGRQLVPVGRPPAQVDLGADAPVRLGRRSRSPPAHRSAGRAARTGPARPRAPAPP